MVSLGKDVEFFRRWKVSTRLEQLHKKFLAKDISAAEIDREYEKLGYKRTLPQNRRGTGPLFIKGVP